MVYSPPPQYVKFNNYKLRYGRCKKLSLTIILCWRHSNLQHLELYTEYPTVETLFESKPLTMRCIPHNFERSTLSEGGEGGGGKLHKQPLA